MGWGMVIDSSPALQLPTLTLWGSMYLNPKSNPPVISDSPSQSPSLIPEH